MRLRLIAAGRLREEYYRAAAGDYGSRIDRAAPFNFEVLEVAPSSAGLGGAPAEESARIDKALKPGRRVVLLDERGRECSTAELAAKVEGWMNSATDVDMVIGGAYGVTGDLRRRADETWSLSKLTLPHELARVVALEAIYRAVTVIKKTPYHHP